MDCPLKKAASSKPNALAFDGITYEELNLEVEKTVSSLKKNGLESGHILALHLSTSIHFIAYLFASMRIGAIFCPMSLRLPLSVVESQLNFLKPKLFISSSEIRVFEAEKVPLQGSSFLLFTSGSTNQPKCVSLTQSNFLSAATTAISVCDYQFGDAWLLSLPLHHVGGLSIIFRSVLTQAQMITDPSNLAITHLSYVPTQLYRSWPIYPKLKTILLSGAPIHTVPARLPIVAAYGMTETASMILGMKSPVEKDGLIYLGFPHSNKECRRAPDGELMIRGDSLFQGYWTGEQLIAPSTWFPTKDLCLYNSEFGYAISGRKDNQFISGGENIQPEEIEKVLMGHESIQEAIVIGIPDEEFGERPIAFIRTLKPIEKVELKKFLLDRLPKYKIPIDFIPLETPNEMKISRTYLKQSLTLERGVSK
jgi:O-succinylbenzoic acid--CoA ligase